MSYFLSGYIQKRILRYALSRLELLDTDALDLENLDIVWGKKSTIELRDVGIHLERISALLKLPPTLTIKKAKISSLRVTVPADLYQSGIALEIDGVDIDVRADTVGEQTEAAIQKSTHLDNGRLNKPSRAVKADRSRRTPPIVHDPGGWPESDESSDDDEDVQLPTTYGLAQSFVQAEPTEERSELQAAVARSLYLNQSQVSGEDSLEGSELGVGTENYLPAFLAGFLKGVGDRVHVSVKNVKVDLDLNLANKDDAQSLEDVKIRLVIGSISVDEASLKTAEVPTRRISMTSTHLLIISEPSLFSNLARSAAPSSPETTHASMTMTAPCKVNDSSPTIANTNLSTPSMDQSIADLQAPQASSRSAYDSVVDDGTISQTASLMQSAKGSTTHGIPHESSMFSDSFYSSEGHDGIENEESEPLHTLQDSSVFGTSLDGMASRRGPERPGASQDGSHIRESPPASFNAFSQPSDNDEAANITTSSSASRTVGAHDLVRSQRDSAASLSGYASPASRPDSSSSEDLSESKIFSHEEAESMYMSAMSSSPLPQSAHASSTRGIHKSPSRVDNQYIAQPEQHENFGNTSVIRHSSSIANEINREKFDSDRMDENDQSRAINTALHAGQGQHRSPDSSSEPAKEKQPAVDGLNATSSPESTSSVSSSREQSVLAKRILLMDMVTLDLPVTSREISAQPPEMSSAHVPTGKSTARSSGYHHAASSTAIPLHNQMKFPDTAPDEKPLESATVITVGSLQIVGDVGLTKLTILLAERLIALHKPTKSGKRKSSHNGLIQQGHYIVAIESLSWKFLDLVKGSFIPESAPLTAFSEDVLLSDGSEILLTSDIRKTELKFAGTKNKTTTKLSVGKFSIGYVDDNILSFDAGLKLRDSMRDVSLPKDQDINLTVIETNGILSVDITTLPIHIVLDLRRLDETFNWFGGFSSMLGLGSSMMSTVTLLDPSVKSPSVNKSSREVHFERPGLSESHEKARVMIKQQRKVTARMGGFVFDLQGTKTAIQLESTAIKVVSRTEGVGLQIDRLIFNGPIFENGDADLSIVAKLSNVRVEYLTIPKENDLTRLLTLLAPSKDAYDDEDDILVDTLIRQRKKGGVLRATVESATLHILDPLAYQCFPLLAEEAKKLATVARYLPDDDRPGLLTLFLIKSAKVDVRVNNTFGSIKFDMTSAELAHVTFPTLVAFGINHCRLCRNDTEELVCKASSSVAEATRPTPSPMIMGRFVGNEMEPTVKLKFHNARFEYHVTTIEALMKLKDHKDAEELLSDMVSSVATLTSRRAAKASQSKSELHGSRNISNPFDVSKALGFDIVFRDSIVGLNPRNSQAQGLLVLTDTHFIGSMPREQDANASLEVRKAELMIIDDLRNVQEQDHSDPNRLTDTYSTQVQILAETGYVSISQISAAKIILHVVQSKLESGPMIDVEIRDDLFVLESCADSTQTVTTILSGLNPPTPTSTALKYQTEVIPVEDMLASFSGEAYVLPRSDRLDGGEDNLDFEEGDLVEDEVPQNLEYISSFYNPDPEYSISESLADSVLDDDLDSITGPSSVREIGDKDDSESFQVQKQIAPGQASLEFMDDHFDSDSTVGGVAHRWNPEHNTYSPTKEKVRGSPLRVRVRDVHIIWNLFDGYDWQHTRDTISQAVAQVQNKAVERQAARKRSSFDPEEEDEDVIGDFLFNSIYIGIPAKSDPADLARQVNRNIDDLVSETGSNATSTLASVSPSRGQALKPKGRRLRLQRSKHHKLTFELRGVCADVVVFPPGSGETESSVDIRVRDLDIFDHVPTSTWKKFATYMHDAGERESGTSMIHIEILNVKPVPNLAASEIVLKVSSCILSRYHAKSLPGVYSTTTFARRPGCFRLHDSLL